MFEKFIAADAHDFRQRYNGCFGFFCRADKKYLVRLSEINSDQSQPYVRFVDKDGQDYLLNSDVDDEEVGFEFIPPRTSWKNTATFGGVLSKRGATRQWIRGVHERNTSFIIPRSKAISVDFNILEEIFLKESPSFLDAYAALETEMKKGRICYAALNGSFALGPFADIMVYDTPIGTYSRDSEGVFQVKLEDVTLFGTEVRDAFNRANARSEVK
jgi:hypothetical protein